MKLISLKSDFAFKELFSHENVRKQFLSDVLKLPLEEIRTAAMKNTHLWTRHRKQKQGILDVLMELADGTKVNVEMQVKCRKHWTKRQLFYLAKMYTEDLKLGEDYDRLNRCISIAVLDFNLRKDLKYHRIYRICDESGEELSDMWEVHVVELRKKLQGTEAVDDWIRLLNAETEEDLEMIKTRSLGILEAIEVVKEMSLTKSLRYWYETELKLRRDRKAEDDYVRDEGRVEDRAEAIMELLEDRGVVSEALKKKVMEQKNLEILRKWHKLAARAQSIEEFEGQISAGQD